MGLINIEKIIPNYIGSEDEKIPKYFAQFNLDRNMLLPCRYMDYNRIETSKADLKINSVKLVETIDGRSIEGQNLTGKKLVILGNINTKFYFNCLKPNECSCGSRKICTLGDCIPFSKFIVVPNSLNENSPINLQYLIENMSTMKIYKNKIFVSLTILIQYVDKY
ncbi:SPOCS domain-containing protein [Clostridium tarantellae]|uniref:DUF3794 domain-containing protein n=1 Tax=Clostridium tarantellae TaxID=39493 RepID=A0A6I1MRF4_9CLOT|nr:SPOCS domain-containing protein [Clostridium tarantellae]MPQ42869.1 DUF3794 domain-containing protein [Clostridium tarantellae]